MAGGACGWVGGVGGVSWGVGMLGLWLLVDLVRVFVRGWAWFGCSSCFVMMLRLRCGSWCAGGLTGCGARIAAAVMCWTGPSTSRSGIAAAGVGCRKRFSVRTKSVLAGSNVGFRKWVIVLYAMVTNLKGVSSVKLGRDLGVA